jgi:hypothetical protein
VPVIVLGLERGDFDHEQEHERDYDLEEFSAWLTSLKNVANVPPLFCGEAWR